MWSPWQRARPGDQKPLELLSFVGAQTCEQSVFIGNVGSECLIDECHSGGGETDGAGTGISKLRCPLHQPSLFEAIHPLTHRTTGDHGPFSDLARREAEGFSLATQCGEEIELPLTQSVTSIATDELAAKLIGKPVKPADDSQRGDIEFRAFTPPLQLDLCNVVHFIHG